MYGDIQVYDVSRGLIDFPAVVAGGGRWVTSERRNERQCRFCESKALLARLLGVSEGTVRYHRKRMKGAMEISDITAGDITIQITPKAVEFAQAQLSDTARRRSDFKA